MWRRRGSPEGVGELGRTDEFAEFLDQLRVLRGHLAPLYGSPLLDLLQQSLERLAELLFTEMGIGGHDGFGFSSVWGKTSAVRSHPTSFRRLV